MRRGPRFEDFKGSPFSANLDTAPAVIPVSLAKRTQASLAHPAPDIVKSGFVSLHAACSFSAPRIRNSRATSEIVTGRCPTGAARLDAICSSLLRSVRSIRRRKNGPLSLVVFDLRFISPDVACIPMRRQCNTSEDSVSSFISKTFSQVIPRLHLLS